MTAAPEAAAARIVILADDLIWATRLVDTVRRAGAVAVPVRSLAAFVDSLGGARGCVVDLTARAYDGPAALAAAASAGVPSVAVGQHDDAALRRAAMDAGADRVYAYRALYEHGDRDLGGWIIGLPADREVAS